MQELQVVKRCCVPSFAAAAPGLMLIVDCSKLYIIYMRKKIFIFSIHHPLIVIVGQSYHDGKKAKSGRRVCILPTLSSLVSKHSFIHLFGTTQLMGYLFLNQGNYS